MKVTYLERAPGVWRLRIETGRAQDGKRLFAYETVRGDEDAAQRRRFEIMSADDAGSFAVPSKVRVAQFFERYVADKLALGKIGRSTAENYKAILRSTLRRNSGTVKLQNVRGPDVQALYTKLVQRGTLTLRTVEHVHRILASAFRTARKQRLVTVNPMEEVERPKPKKAKPKAIAESALGEVREALRGKWFELPTLARLTAGHPPRRDLRAPPVRRRSRRRQALRARANRRVPRRLA
jgi:integrase